MAKKARGAVTLDSLMDEYGKDVVSEPIKLDVAVLNDLWGGGIFPGYMYSLWAEPGGGKSTLTIQVAKSLCRKSLRVLWLDSEKALNPNQIESFGLKQYVDNGTFILFTISNYEDLEKCVEAASNEDIALVVVDSESMLRAVTPQDQKVTDVRPGLKALQSSHVLNKAKDLFYKSGIASIIIFHARANINIGGPVNMYAPTTKQAGGWVAQHAPDVITKIAVGSKLKDDDTGEIIGANIRISCEKNKFASPFKVYEKKLIYGKGISARIDLIDTCIEAGIIVQSGAYFQMPWGENIRGRKTLYDLPADKMKQLKESVS